MNAVAIIFWVFVVPVWAWGMKSAEERSYEVPSASSSSESGRMWTE